MKYLKRFENLQESKLEYLIDILRDVFDQWDIYEPSSDSQEGFPDYKFWSPYGLDSICVYNIRLDQSEQFYQDVMSLRDQVEEFVDKKLVVIQETISPDMCDFIIELQSYNDI